jgi:hypothetical protein
VGVCAMGSSPLELNGTSVGKGVNAHAVSTESRSNGLGFGLHAEDIRENVSANCFSTDLEEVFAVRLKAFNFDRSILNRSISNLCPLTAANLTLETIVALVRVLALDNVPDECHTVVGLFSYAGETHAGRC